MRQESEGPPNDGVPHPADRQPVTATIGVQSATVQLAQASQVPSSLPIAPGETSSSAIAARERAAVEARFIYAERHPRVFDRCRLRLLSACERPAFAKEARYEKPVGDKKVNGLSIRFAEEARVLWGNLDVTTLAVFDDETRRIYRVQAIDLETNATESFDVIIEKFVERKVVRAGMEVISQRANTKGEIVYRIRATEDDLLNKVNNHISKYRRNAILSLIPADVKEECEQRIIETLKNRDAKDPEGARRDILEAFFRMGIEPDQIVAMLAKPIEQVNPAELSLLRGYYTALKEGEATWQEILDQHRERMGKPAGASQTGTETEKKGTDGLRDKLAGSKKTGVETASAAGSAPATPVAGVCEFCKANLAKGEKHRQDCEALK